MTGQQDRKHLDAGGIIPLLAGVQRKLGPGALAIVRVGDHRMVAEIELVELRAVGELLRREPLGLAQPARRQRSRVAAAGRIEGSTPPNYIFPARSARRAPSDGPRDGPS